MTTPVGVTATSWVWRQQGFRSLTRFAGIEHQLFELRLRMDLLPSHRKFELTPTGGMTTLPIYAFARFCTRPDGP